MLELNLVDQIKRTGKDNVTSDGVVVVRPLAWGNYGHASQIASELAADRPLLLTHIVCSDLVRDLIYQLYMPLTIAAGLFS